MLVEQEQAELGRARGPAVVPEQVVPELGLVLFEREQAELGRARGPAFVPEQSRQELGLVLVELEQAAPEQARREPVELVLPPVLG